MLSQGRPALSIEAVNEANIIFVEFYFHSDNFLNALKH
jgi:hypothetical protein